MGVVLLLALWVVSIVLWALIGLQLGVWLGPAGAISWVALTIGATIVLVVRASGE